MKRMIVFCFLLIIESNLFCQNKNIDINNKLEVITFISKKIKSSDYLIYNIGHSFMVISKQKHRFKIFYIEQRLNIKSQQNEYSLVKIKTIKNCDYLNNVFKNDVCNFDIINESEAGEKYLFFSLTLCSYTVCEFFMPTFYYSSGQKDIKLPIDKELFIYLNSLFINFNNG